MKKRAVLLVFFVLLLAALSSACEKDGARQGLEELSSSELMGTRFMPVKTSIPGEAFRTVSAVSAGDSIICVGALGEDALNKKYSVYRIDPDANTAVLIQGISLEGFETLDALGDGNALVTYVDSSDDFHLIEIAPDNSTSEYVLELPEEMKGAYYPSVLLTDEGYLFNDGFRLTAIDRSGKQISDKGRFDRFTDIMRRSDGNYLAVNRPRDNKTVFMELGQDFGVTAEYSLDETFASILQCGAENEVFVCKEDVIYRINYKTGEKQSYANIYASGSLGGSSFVFLENESFFDGTKNFFPAIWHPQNGDEKRTITLGTYMPEQYDTINAWELKKVISSFNESNDTYEVVLVDYAAYGEAGYDILLSDISLGNTTDIYDLYYLDSVLASRGVLKDLYPLFEKEGIDLGDMNGSVMDALDMNGKLFYFMPSYTVTTYVGRRSVIGDGKIDSDKFYALAEEYGASDIFDAGITKEEFFIELLTSAAGEFIDYSNASCSFDSPEFKRCLAYARKLPDALSADTEDHPFGAGAYSGSALFMKCALGNEPIRDYLRCKSIFQGDMSACGFPVSSGSGAFFTQTIMLGLAENSPNQEGAWEFFKYMLSDNYQWHCYGLPMNKGIMEQRIDGWVEMFRAPVLTIGLDMPGNGGVPEEVVIDYLPADEAVKNEVLDIIYRVDSLNSYDTAVLEIIMAEMGKLGSGSESVDTAAANIQSKASIYMGEQYG